MSTSRLITGLIIWFVITFAIAFLGSIFSPAAGTSTGVWYSQINKPSFTPPSWVFAPAWTLLYAMMAVSAWLVWKQAGFSGAPAALTIFLIQLVLNFLWSWLFFGRHEIGWAFFDIVFLWMAIFATIILFWQKIPLAGALMLPYLGWVSFASALNFAIWRLNS